VEKANSDILLSNWTGTCALVQLAIPFTLAFHQVLPMNLKAHNQTATGFESAHFWWSTINKNVDWINYIYYNQQKFINYIWDALQGVVSWMPLARWLGKTG
jgi:hypothetical protein